MILARLPFSFSAASLSMLIALSQESMLSESYLLLFLFQDPDAFLWVTH